MERIKAGLRAGEGCVRLGAAMLASLAMLAPSAAFAARELNLQPPVTPIATEIFDLHLLITGICAVIFVVVFSVMFYSIFAHRKSKGHKAAQFHENTLVEVVWTVIPFLILLVMAFPATKTILAMKDTSVPDMTVKVTGYQWKWQYDYLDHGFSFVSNLATPASQIIGWSFHKPHFGISSQFVQDVVPFFVGIDGFMSVYPCGSLPSSSRKGFL